MGEGKIFEGKTTNEAIEKGLKDLGIKREDAQIKVLENDDKRSFFSILAPRVVKVEIISKNDERQAKEKRNRTNCISIYNFWKSITSTKKNFSRSLTKGGKNSCYDW